METEKETGRMEAFSDGVFAIAITLLILDIKVPTAAFVHQKHMALLAALGHQWPGYLAYITSFLTILIMWVNHHKMFQQIRRCDHFFLILNGFLLLGVTTVPFPTALLAEYIREPGANAKVAALAYSGLFIFIGIIFHMLWRYAATGNRLLGSNHDPVAVRAITQQYRFGPVLYVVTFLLAFVSVPVSVAANLLLAVFFALPGANNSSTN
jgi:uncharacterized membrane protein